MGGVASSVVGIPLSGSIEDKAQSFIDKVEDLVVGEIKMSLTMNVTAPAKLIGSIVSGDSWSGAFEEFGSDITQAHGDFLQTEYLSVYKPLGLDDRSWFGKIIKDIYYDDAYSTAAIGVIVAALVLSYVSAGTMSTWSAGAIAGAGAAMSGVAYAAYVSAVILVEIIVNMGIALIIGGVINGALSHLMNPKTIQIAMQQLMRMQEQEAKLRYQNLIDVADGTVFEKMAGGVIYNETYSGGDLYEYDQKNSLAVSVGGEFGLSEGNKLINHVDADQAGGGLFENKFNLNIVNTDVSESSGGMPPQEAIRMRNLQTYNKLTKQYNAKTETYNDKVAQYKSIADSYNKLPSAKKTKSRYQSTMKQLSVIESRLGGMEKEIIDIRKSMENVWKKPWEK